MAAAPRGVTVGSPGEGVGGSLGLSVSPSVRELSAPGRAPGGLRTRTPRDSALPAQDTCAPRASSRWGQLATARGRRRTPGPPVGGDCAIRPAGFEPLASIKRHLPLVLRAEFPGRSLETASMLPASSPLSHPLLLSGNRGFFACLCVCVCVCVCVRVCVTYWRQKGEGEGVGKAG